MILNKYQPIETIYHRGYSSTCKVHDVDENICFAKWIKGIEKDSRAGKILKDKIRHLKKAKHESIPSIMDFGWDEQEKAYCTIYELLNATPVADCAEEVPPSYFLSGMIRLSFCLQYLQQKHRLFHGDLTPSNILVDENHNFYLVDFGIADITATLSQAKEIEVFAKEFAAPEKWDRNIPKGFPNQSDIYSIGKIIEWYFKEIQQQEPEIISSLINDCCQTKPEDRIQNYGSLIERLQKVESSPILQKENTVYIAGVSEEQLEELNSTKFKPKFEVSSNASSENILVDIVTDNWWFHCLWITDEECFESLSTTHKDEETEKYQNILKFGKPLEISLSFTDDDYASFELTPVLRQLQQDKQIQQAKRKGKKGITRELSFYENLLKEEKKEIEKNALRLNYKKFEIKGSTEIHFHLNANKKYSSDAQIYSHIDVANAPKADEFEFIISATADRKQIKDPVKLVGVAYDFDSEKRIIRFKDCEQIDKDSIPVRGYVFENTSQQEEEKNRQLAAIKKVEHNEAQSMELIHALFHAEDLEGKFLDVYELDTIYQKDDKNIPFQYSDNQTTAILNAIHRSPLSVIQGPPGTGKTTVITEIVMHLLHNDPNAKIMITSQTNDAVDNVLDNLVKESIPLVRLSGVRTPKLDSLKKHTLEKKIEGWKQQVANRAKSRFGSKKNQFLKAAEQKDIFSRKLFEFLLENKKWNERKKQLLRHIERLDPLAELKDFLESEAQFIAKLSEKYGEDTKAFLNEWQIHRDWIAAISALNNQSSMNQKLIDSIRVIGATCNHIASKKYSKFNFEFDYVIMDESGKATIAESLVPIVMAERAILVGDHRQLRPMLTSNRKVESWLRDKFKEEGEAEGYDGWEDYFNRPSLFEQVITSIDEDYKSQLTECRRCTAEQVQLISTSFYEPEGDEPIQPVDRPQEKEHNLDLKVDSSVIFLNTGYEHRSEIDGSGSSYNAKNAELIPKLLKRLDHYKQTKDYSIGIITGYKAQLRRIRREVQNKVLFRKNSLRNIKNDQITTSVIDKFQGLEKDIIIFDLTRSCHDQKLGFLANANRINVALSRQKKLVIIIGNYEGIMSAKPRGNKKDVALQRYLKNLKEESIVNSLDQVF